MRTAVKCPVEQLSVKHIYLPSDLSVPIWAGVCGSECNGIYRLSFIRVYTEKNIYRSNK